MRTGNNERFIRYWSEISINKAGFGFTASDAAEKSGKKWFPYNKGGDFRRWYGNNDFLVNWENDGLEIKEDTIRNYPQLTWDKLGWKISNERDFFKPCLEWSRISSDNLGVRISDGGFLFDTNGSSAFPELDRLHFLVAFLCTNLSNLFSKIVNPSLAFQPGDLAVLPLIGIDKIELKNKIDLICINAIELSKRDWDSFETSWDFKRPWIFFNDLTDLTIERKYETVKKEWANVVSEMKALEEANNLIFIELYGLASEVSYSVPIKEITLKCNPSYRYGENHSIEDYDMLLKCDSVKELLSYSIGCMMGRYSIDKPGLILASQGETLQDYLNQIPNPRFMPDSDAILPLTDQEWFADDVTNRVREFVKVVWGEETLQENLAFIAESLCLHAIKSKKSEGALDTIRRYLSTQFYKDHLKTYKKRPIYWLFSSGKEKAFECLVYLHRYNESTLARMRTEYVTPLMGKYDAQHSLLLEQKTDASPAQQRELEKELKALEKKQTELRAFDEQLKHYADMRIKLDLDDGVKVNYGKFGNLLAEVKAVTGDKGD